MKNLLRLKRSRMMIKISRVKTNQSNKIEMMTAVMKKRPRKK